MNFLGLLLVLLLHVSAGESSEGGLACEQQSCDVNFLQTELRLQDDMRGNQTEAKSNDTNSVKSTASKFAHVFSDFVSLMRYRSQKEDPTATLEQSEEVKRPSAQHVKWAFHGSWKGKALGEETTGGAFLVLRTAASRLEWTCFTCTFLVCMFLQHAFHRLNSENALTPFLLVLFWLGMAVVCTVGVGYISDEVNADEFVTGYIQELVFSMDNVFAFLTVMDIFGTSQRRASWILGAVVLLQIFFQLFLYMGLANSLRDYTMLPYILGIWLLFLGISAIISGVHTKSGKADPSNAPAVMLLKKLWKKQSMRFHGTKLFVEQDDGNHMTLMIPLLLTLAFTDLFLEVDVTLTKIEMSDNSYISFTSSALASFMIPALYFVMQQLLKCLPLLHYGLCFVLVFFGVQMCIEQYLEISGLLGCGIVLAALTFSGLCSYFLTSHHEKLTTALNDHSELESLETDLDDAGSDFDETDESCLSFGKWCTPSKTR